MVKTGELHKVLLALINKYEDFNKIPDTEPLKSKARILLWLDQMKELEAKQ